jgi:hypothetical protein
MQVKNISGKTLTLGFGKRTHVLTDDQTVTLDDDQRTLNAVAEHLKRGRIEIVRGTEAQDSGRAATTPDYILIHVKAVGNDADTITITPEGMRDQIFEMDAVPTASIPGATAVDIGATAAVTAANLKTALNANTVLAGLGLVADEVVLNGTGVGWVLVKLTGSAKLDTLTVAASAAARIAISKVAATTHQSVGQQVIYVPAAGATTLVVPTAFSTILHYTAVTQDVNGAALAYDGTITAFGGALFFDDDGDVDLTATSKLIVTVYGK